MDHEDTLPSFVLTLLEDLHFEIQESSSALYQLALAIESGAVCPQKTSRENAQ